MRLSRGLVVVVALLLGGCASLEAVHTNQGLLDEYRLLATWSPQQTAKKIAMLEKTYDRYPTDENRLRLAVVHGFGSSEKAQREWAMDLFKMTQASAPNSSTGTLAGLFLEVMKTRRELADTQEQLEKQLSQTRWTLKKERQKIKALEKKLKAVTTIEKSLHLRD